MPWWLRVVLAVVLVVVGFALGIASVLVHQGRWGLVLAVSAPAATAYALPGGWWTRGAFTAGWVGAVVMFYLQRPEGDFVLSADAHGYTVLVFALVLTSFTIATLRPLRPPRGPDGPAGADPPPMVRQDPAGDS